MLHRPTAPWPDFRRNLVAILRGITLQEIDPAIDALVEAGFEAIEIPLNSPQPFDSIERAVRRAPQTTLVGAGTVLAASQVDRLADAGGRLVVSPNIDIEVLAAARRHAMVTMPGVFTATEAFAALKHGASGLKFFPASVLGAAGIKAVMAVLPAGTVVGAVGGVSDADFAAYAKAGVTAFGLGSSLYAPGVSSQELAARAASAVAAWDAVFAA